MGSAPWRVIESLPTETPASHSVTMYIDKNLGIIIVFFKAWDLKKQFIIKVFEFFIAASVFFLFDSSVLSLVQ